MTLYHFTCDHAHPRILESGVLLPAAELGGSVELEPSQYVWLTDLSVPVADQLGLTANYITCDRTRHRYRVVELGSAMRWTDVRRSMPQPWRDLLECSPGARPAHWFVSRGPVPVIYDPLPARV